MSGRSVVVASGDVSAADRAWIDSADYVVAADGGASALDRLGRRPDLLVGDMDSVDTHLLEGLAAAGVPIERHSPDKEASDMELALAAAMRTGSSQMVILGATGGQRLDHEIANLLLLADPALAGWDVVLVRGASGVRALHAGGRMVLDARPGDLVSLLPVGGDAVGVVTWGLRWPLAGDSLPMGRSRGLSNEVVAAPAWVALGRGTLLVVTTTVGGGTE